MQIPNIEEEIDLESKHALGDIKSILEESEYRKPEPEYNQRHITTLKPVSAWTAEEIINHKAHNRILQDDYSALNADEIIELAVLTKEDWLTDWVCPQIEPGCKLNIAADLVVKYKVSAEDLNSKTHEIFDKIKTIMPDALPKIEANVNEQLILEQEKIRSNAIANMKKKYPNIDENNINPKDKKFMAFIAVETERRRKEIQHEMTGKFLEPLYKQFEAELELNAKPIYAKGQNNDFAFLGAAGSGKSTIAKQFLTEEDKLNSVVLATDDYRGVVLHDHHEKIQTDQVFIRTQDTAYCIKELVQARLQSNPQQQRPNIILDCVTLEWWHKNLLQGNQSTTSALACLDDISLVPGRAYLRAIDDKSGPADKGRQVNTTSLLEGHKGASERVLSSLPNGVKSTLFNTNIPFGSKPSVFATVDLTDGKREIEVTNLSKLSNFLCKSNVNIKAEFPEQLYYHQEESQLIFKFDRHHQAEQVLNMVKSKPNANPNWAKQPYDMLLSSHGVPYATIHEISPGNLGLEILNMDLFRKKWHSHGQEGDVLKSLVMQIHWGSLANVREKISELGSEAQAARVAIAAVGPDVLQFAKQTQQIPPYAINVMITNEAPTLQSLREKFGGMDAQGQVKQQITVIPLIIKDSNDRIWMYGRKANGAPHLTELINKEVTGKIYFPKSSGEITTIKPNLSHQPLYNYLADTKSHYYNYKVLQEDERNRRVTEVVRRDKEYMRQHMLFDKSRKSQNDSAKVTRPVHTSAILPIVETDVLADISKIDLSTSQDLKASQESVKESSKDKSDTPNQVRRKPT